MHDAEQRQDYIAKAERAEKEAAKTNDIVDRNSLLKAAKNYRKLAAFIHARTAMKA